MDIRSDLGQPQQPERKTSRQNVIKADGYNRARCQAQEPYACILSENFTRLNRKGRQERDGERRTEAKGRVGGGLRKARLIN